MYLKVVAGLESQSKVVVLSTTEPHVQQPIKSHPYLKEHINVLPTTEYRVRRRRYCILSLYGGIATHPDPLPEQRLPAIVCTTRRVIKVPDLSNDKGAIQ